jgi:hypothetical protein
MIRSSSDFSPAEDQQVSDYIRDISHAVQDTAARTYDAVRDLSHPALKKHAVPVVEVLDDCRQSLLEVDVRSISSGNGREKIPPLAFKTARAMKVYNPSRACSRSIDANLV